MNNLISISARFTRAVHIRYDFRDLRYRLDGYVVTPLVQQTAVRILRGLESDSRERAFSITGPFGAGKSAFALFLAHFLQRTPTSRRQLLHSLHASDALNVDVPSLLAVLTPGNNGSLRQAVVQSLLDALHRARIKVPDVLQDQQIEKSVFDPVKIAELVMQIARYLKAHRHYDGLVLIIDELGQYLDYAARHNDERDLFVLQTLAETAARSGDAPVTIVTILHQAFEQYTLHAGARRRIEWAKVQGRFVDLVFQEPLSQMVRLVAAALRPAYPDPLHLQRLRWADHIVPITETLGLRPREIVHDEWRQIIFDTFPLHPMVVLALPGIVRQLAQNERSLFALLSSDEPWGLRDVVYQAQLDDIPIYRLSHLFNYVETNLGASLFARTRGRRWAEIVEARAGLGNSDPLLLDTLTVVGMLNALERAANMRACQAHVAFALTDDPTNAKIANALEALHKRQHIIYRRYRDSFVLWEGSDLDIEALMQQARHSLAERYSLSQLLLRYADTTPRIAYRHSYRTGATRAFTIRYVDINQLSKEALQHHGFAGELLHVVPADQEEMLLAEQWALHPDRQQEVSRIVILPQHVYELRDLALDVAALHTLITEHEALEHDRVARREVTSRLLEAEQALRDALNDAYGTTSRWFYRGQRQHVVNLRQIDELLSLVADTTYPLAPRIWNELIVRDSISSAAVKARRNIVEALLTRADQALLGITGYPPERAIYASIFQLGGLHRQNERGEWEIGSPRADDPLHLLPAWQALETKLSAAETSPLSLSELYRHLEQPPFGVKAGVVPLLFVAYYVARAGEVIFYEHGNYVPFADIALFERMLARPDYFAVRLCRAEGVRKVLYQRLAEVFAPQALHQRVQPALLAVALPLLRAYHQLPTYSKQTKQLSLLAQSVRQALREATAPDQLLFELLPTACQLDPFTPQDPVDLERIELFIACLRDCLHELQRAFPSLRQFIIEEVMHAFGLHGEYSAAHRELLQRYQHMLAVVNDPQIHALGVRLETAPTDGESWAISLAALVVKRPPEQWHDADIPVFQTAIAELARRFRATEEMIFTVPSTLSERDRIRISIMNGKGEVSRVIYLNHNDNVCQLREELYALFTRYASVGAEQQLSVLAEVAQQLLIGEKRLVEGSADANEA